MVGAALGAAGAGVARVLSLHVGPIAPWLVVAGLAFAALDLGRFLPRIPLAGGLSRKLGAYAQRLPPVGRAAALGAITALLPCGLLAGGYVFAAASGSMWGGTLTMAAFAVVTSPGTLLAQLPVGWLQQKLGPNTWLRRALPAAAAILVAWRAVKAGHAAPDEHSSCH